MERSARNHCRWLTRPTTDYPDDLRMGRRGEVRGRRLEEGEELEKYRDIMSTRQVFLILTV